MSFPVDGTIPGPNDLFSVSQNQIKTNFNNLIGWAAVDHVGYGVSSSSGTHNQITFPNVTTQGIPTDPVSILFTKNDANSHPQLFFLNSQNSLQQSATGVYASQGSCVLFGGVILKWGLNGGAPSPVTYTQAFPNNTFVVQATPYAVQAITDITGGASKTGFTFSGNTSFFWVAIGF